MGLDVRRTDRRQDAGGQQGPIVLLAHGWGHDRGVWGDVAALLADRSTTVACDARGFGDSEDLLIDPASWTLDTAVDDLAALVASFAPASVVAVGHSFQGSAVLALAARGVAGLAAVVAIGAAPRWTNTEGYALAIDAAQAEALVTMLEADYVAMIEQLIGGYFPDADQEAAAKALAHSVAIARRVRRAEVPVRILERSYEQDIRELLPQIHIPVLLIHGERDVVASPAVGSYLEEHTPGARLEIVPGAGHCPHMTYPHRVAALIEAFVGQLGIRKVPSAPTSSSLPN